MELSRQPNLPPGTGCSSGFDVSTFVLSLGLCVGLIISYLPQHLRIIRAGTSEGFSPWYLLLGATSSGSGMLNLLIFTWPILGCCKEISVLSCFARSLGLVQVTLQWLLFTIILVLYMVYFPPHLKYQRTLPLRDPAPTPYADTQTRPADDGEISNEDVEVIEERVNGYRRKVYVKVMTTPEWTLAVAITWVVAVHLALLSMYSVYLMTTHSTFRQQNDFAIFLGLSGTLLAVLQYAPQIYKTYRAGLVGALSIGTMVIQVPGSVLFVLSIAIRPGVNWTSWIPYAVTGAMQGALLVICIAWKRRQAKLGVDDFGNPVEPVGSSEDEGLLRGSD